MNHTKLTSVTLTDAEIVELAIALKRPAPHEHSNVLITGSNLGHRRFRSAGDNAHVNAEDLVLFARAVEAALTEKNANDTQTWQDLLGSTDPVFLNEAADLAERYGRTEWADAMRESAENFEPHTVDN